MISGHGKAGVVIRNGSHPLLRSNSILDGRYSAPLLSHSIPILRPSHTLSPLTRSTPPLSQAIPSHTLYSAPLSTLSPLTHSIFTLYFSHAIPSHTLYFLSHSIPTLRSSLLSSLFSQLHPRRQVLRSTSLILLIPSLLNIFTLLIPSLTLLIPSLSPLTLPIPCLILLFPSVLNIRILRIVV